MTEREFPRVLAAEGVSNFGAILSRLAIPWLAVLSLQATPLQMAWLGIADVAAAALGALLLGGWIDRHGKRAVMLWCDALRCAVLLAVALGAWRSWISLPALLLAAAATGVLSLGFELARSAWMAQRLAAGELPRRNAQLSMVSSLSETAAFALGGWLYQWLGAVTALLVDAASYLVSALCLRGVAPGLPPAPKEAAQVARPVGAPAVPTTGSMLAGAVAGAVAAAGPGKARAGIAGRSRWVIAAVAEASEGLRVVASSGPLRALAGVEMLRACSHGLVGTVILIFISRDLAVPTGQQGLIFATGALGALAGAAWAPALGRRIGAGRAMSAGLLAFAVGTACVPLAGSDLGSWGPWAVLAWLVLHQLVGDAGYMLYEVHDRTLRQTAVPPDRLARADAGLRSLGLAATLLAMLGGGLLGEALGAGWVLWLAVAAGAGAALLAGLTLGRQP